MTFVIKDRVKETSATTGTGTLTLAGAATGYQSFSVIGNSNTTFYGIEHQTANEWEVGVGTYSSSGTTLARTTIISSSNSGSAVDLSAGTKNVFVTLPAQHRGVVLQVVQVVKTDTFSTTSSLADVTGLAASITPSSTTSQVLGTVSLGGMSAGDSTVKAKVQRGTTDIYVGDAAGNRPRVAVHGQMTASYKVESTAFTFLDAPATTSSTTYKVVFGGNGSNTVYVNRSSRDNNNTSEDPRSASSVTLMEISA